MKQVNWSICMSFWNAQCAPYTHVHISKQSLNIHAELIRRIQLNNLSNVHTRRQTQTHTLTYKQSKCKWNGFICIVKSNDTPANGSPHWIVHAYSMTHCFVLNEFCDFFYHKIKRQVLFSHYESFWKLNDVLIEILQWGKLKQRTKSVVNLIKNGFIFRFWFLARHQKH